MTAPVEFRRVRFTGIQSGNLQPVILKSGEPSIETIKHWWAVCDVCGEGTWVAADHFSRESCSACGAKRCNRKAICCESCRHPVGLKCRMTPRCPGKHRKAETDDDDHD